MLRTVKLLALSVLLSASACGGGMPSPNGGGSIDVRVWGEEFVAQEIPSTVFEDRWSVRFSRFLVHVSGARFAATGGGSYAVPGPGRVWDLKPAVMPLSIATLTGVEARRLDQVQFELSATATDSTAGNATPQDLALMRDGRYKLYVEGTATHGTRGEYSFRWGFTGSTRFTNCVDDMMARGLVVTSGSAPTLAQITVHADHLFYDGLQNADAKVRFDAIAGADRNMDRMVTLDELAAVDLTSLPTGQYQTGSARNVNTLRDFVTALTGTMGHWNGEGHCDEAPF